MNVKTCRITAKTKLKLKGKCFLSSTKSHYGDSDTEPLYDFITFSLLPFHSHERMLIIVYETYKL